MATQHNISGGLFYIIGASGAGKDSLIHTVCDLAQPPDHLRIAPRYITRPASVIDRHIEISEPAFRARRDAGEFLFDWSAHGFEYAISADVLAWVAAGQRVLVDGSRAYLEQARAGYPGLQVIGIDARLESLPGRLQQRGREDEAAIAERLQRNVAYQSCLDQVDWRIENNWGIEHAAAQMLAVIRGI